MPPIASIATVQGTLVAATTTFMLPSRAVVGDVLLAVVATDNSVSTLAGSNAGWDYVSSVGGPAKLNVLRRVMKATDGPSVSVVSSGSPVWSLSALVVLRGADGSKPNVGAFAANTITASTAFDTPSQTLTSCSDLYVAIELVTTAAIAVNAIPGGTQLIEIQSGGRTLEVAVLYQEFIGATGVRHATTSSAQSGIAGSLALAALPFPTAKTIIPDIAGAIGFVEVGV